MWIVIEATAKYTFRARTVGVAGGWLGVMLVVTDNTTGALLSSQFMLGLTAEMIQTGW